ncbi:MAG: ssl1498 family light-harvesting-like protein [Prochloron sp. SP5CPC1]|nr:ssl1498 family light-harvesting-like protein [Candidatus Paraprochloron terpiosi SP5CPC1]
MPYTNEEGGRLNNFAAEPKMYTAEAPTKNQQRNYLILGGAGLLLIGGLIFVAVSISNIG